MKKPNPEFLAKVERYKAGDRSALNGMTAIPVFRYPQKSDSPEVKKVVGRASRLASAMLDGRADRTVIDRRRELLHEAMRPLPMERLNYWRRIDMISPKWQGATGGGHKWAVASEEVNNAAAAELQRRPAFVIE